MDPDVLQDLVRSFVNDRLRFAQGGELWRILVVLRRFVKVDAVRANLVNGLDLRINPLAGPEVAFSPVDHGDQRKLRVVHRHLVFAKRVEQSSVQVLEPAATGVREGTARLVEDQVVRRLVDLEIPQWALL